MNELLKALVNQTITNVQIDSQDHSIHFLFVKETPNERLTYHQYFDIREIIDERFNLVDCEIRDIILQFEEKCKK